MPDENIEILDDFILDMDIETISLDNSTVKENNDRPKKASSQSTENTLDQNMEAIGDLDINMSSIDMLGQTPEPEIPNELMESQDKLSESIEEIRGPIHFEKDLNRDTSIFDSSDEIISINGNDLDKVIYGHHEEGPVAPDHIAMDNKIEDIHVIEQKDLLEDFSTPQELPDIPEELISTSQVFQNTADHEEIIPVAEETVSEEEPLSNLNIQQPDIEMILEDHVPADNIEINLEDNELNIPEEISMQTDTGILPDLDTAAAANHEFNFDLSVIPDVAEIEEDEPIALSLDELNKIDISGDDSAAAAQQDKTQTVSEPPEINLTATPPSKHPAAISLDELNEVQRDISPKADITDLNTHVIEEKMETLSDETKDELKSVLCYLDNLLEDLPEDKIKEFAKSEYYDLYVKILDKLGI